MKGEGMGPKVSFQGLSITWRDGRPRYTPGPEMRKALALKGQDLKHPNGDWLSIVEAFDWGIRQKQWVEEALARKAEAAATRRRVRLPARPEAPRQAGPSIASLRAGFFASPRVTGGKAGKRVHKPLAANTLRFYRQKLDNLEQHDPELYHGPAMALTRAICSALYERLWEERGMAAAKAIMSSLSVVLSWAIRTGKLKLPANPAYELDMETPPERLRAATPAEIAQLVAAADLPVYPGRYGVGRVALHEVGDMTILGVWTGQRQADRRAMTAADLPEGRLRSRQAKTSALVDFPQAPQLIARLAEAKRRRADWPVQPVELIVNHSNRRPFVHGTDYAHMFARVRAAAVAGVWRDRDGTLHIGPADEQHEAFAGWQIQPMASLADFTDQDLRDTCVTWLARAGCDAIRISAITGHSLKTIHAILKHYLVAHADYGDQAIARMVDWFDEQAQAEDGRRAT